MSNKFNYLVFIGRFMPFHKAHYNVVKQALSISDNVILVLGSHDSPRTSRNPFTTKERIQIISSCFTTAELNRIHFLPQYDYSYNDQKWITSIQAGIRTIIWKNWDPNPIKIGLIGKQKDHTSYYLKFFPDYESVGVLETVEMNASDIRNWLYDWQKDYNPNWFVSENHKNLILRLAEQESFSKVREEHFFVQKYKEQWKAAPYPPIFQTVDAVVVQSGHILLVERGAAPGEGLFALPGGFLNQWEKIRDGVLRELREETKLKVPDPVLIGNIQKEKVYDYPYRSLRGRTITNAFYIKLPDATTLPKIKGSDDAKSAMWVKLSDVKRNNMFEDHFDIIDDMVGGLNA